MKDHIEAVIFALAVFGVILLISLTLATIDYF